MLRLRTLNLRWLIPHLETLKVQLASWTVLGKTLHLKRVVMTVQVAQQWRHWAHQAQTVALIRRSVQAMTPAEIRPKIPVSAACSERWCEARAPWGFQASPCHVNLVLTVVVGVQPGVQAEECGHHHGLLECSRCRVPAHLHPLTARANLPPLVKDSRGFLQDKVQRWYLPLVKPRDDWAEGDRGATHFSVQKETHRRNHDGT